MIEPKRFSLVKPTSDTPFHIDFDWWKQHDNNYRVYLHDCLCQQHREVYSNLDDESWIDWINPDTAEVIRVDGLQHVLISHCAQQPGFLTLNTTLVDAVFRVFLANSNKPMTPNDLATQVNRPADTILRTLAGPQIYKGLRPCHN